MMSEVKSKMNELTEYGKRETTRTLTAGDRRIDEMGLQVATLKNELTGLNTQVNTWNQQTQTALETTEIKNCSRNFKLYMRKVKK